MNDAGGIRSVGGGGGDDEVVESSALERFQNFRCSIDKSRLDRRNRRVDASRSTTTRRRHRRRRLPRHHLSSPQRIRIRLGLWFILRLLRKFDTYTHTHTHTQAVSGQPAPPGHPAPHRPAVAATTTTTTTTTTTDAPPAAAASPSLSKRVRSLFCL